MKLVTIVTVNFNETNVTLDFLRSILENKGDHPVEVILIDNGCRDNDEELFKKTYPGLIHIRSSRNLGFAGGNNLGIPKARGDYLLFLNNDTEITTGSISSLVAELEKNKNIGLISPLLLYHEEPTRIQYAGFTPMNYYSARNRTIGKFEHDQGQFDGVSHETGFCHGAAMMCRRKDLERVGLMDENYFLYYEEMDWCEKFKRAGLKIWFTGNAKIYHKESMSVGKESALKTYFTTRNRILFIRKNGSKTNRLFFTIYYYSLAGPALILKYLLESKKELAKGVWAGMRWNIKQSKDSNLLEYVR